MLRSRKFWKGRSRKSLKLGVGSFGMLESDILPPTPQPCCAQRSDNGTLCAQCTVCNVRKIVLFHALQAL